MIVNIDMMLSDIENGYHGVSGLCPIARAMSRTGLIQPIVTTSRFSFGYNGVRYWGDLPQVARYFVADFDANKYVVPISFKLTTDTEVVQNG